MRRTVAALLACLLTLSAADAKSPLKKPKRGFQGRVPAFTIQPSEDWEGCLFGELPNKKAMDVSGFELAMPAGAHHFVLWRYDGDVSKAPRAWALNAGCTGVGGGTGYIVPNNLFGMQTPNGRLRFPPGVAVRIDAHQPILFNPHMKNFGTEPVTPDVRFNVIPAKKGSVKHLAQSLTIGNVAQLRVPARSNFRMQFDWVVPADVYIVQLSTHQHALGTRTVVDLLNADGSAVQENLIENDSWEHPVEWWPATPRLLQQGQTLRTTCEWTSDRDGDTTFGTETTDEMCFLTGYVYKADDSQPLPACQNCACLRPDNGVLCFSPAVSSGTF